MDMENNTNPVSDPVTSDKKLITGIVKGILDKEKLFQTAFFMGMKTGSRKSSPKSS